MKFVAFLLFAAAGGVFAHDAAARTKRSAAASPDGECRSRSSYYPWGRSPLRTWTPKATAAPEHPIEAPGAAFGRPFSARLVIAYGVDTMLASRTVLLEMSSGCRRQFPADSFVQRDRAIIDRAVSRHPFAADAATYLALTPATAAYLESPPPVAPPGTLKSYSTQHFTFWYGVKTGSASYRWLRENNTDMETVLKASGAFAEQVWNINRDILKAPMPYAKSAVKLKLNVFICGTGLPWHGKRDEVDWACGTSAAEIMEGPITSFLAGSDPFTHEVGHMLQFFSGGGRNRNGPAWETGAQWNSFAINPIQSMFRQTYQNNLENGPLFSHTRYGAFPVIMYFQEKDATRGLYWRAWTENRRKPNGDAAEDFLEAFVRIGMESGIYPDGYRSFADDMGWYGARLVAMDFENQRVLLDTTLATRSQSTQSHFYTPLAAAATGDPTLFASPVQRPLLEWGTHLVPLTPTGGTVSVTLTGGTQAHQAAWRFAIVAVKDGTIPYYSKLGVAEGLGSGTTSLAAPPGTKLYLAVTATPYVYESLPWQPEGPTVGTQFPYTVRITGATPRTGSPVPCDPAIFKPLAANMNYNVNGYKMDGKPC